MSKIHQNVIASTEILKMLKHLKKYLHSWTFATSICIMLSLPLLITYSEIRLADLAMAQQLQVMPIERQQKKLEQ